MKASDKTVEMKIEKIKYVVGFCFDYARERVALILKSKPEWQKGKYNGIGGKIEKDETPLIAMQREFLEETGANIWAWNLFCKYEGEDFIVYFFKAFSKEIENVTTTTDEKVKVFKLSDPFQYTMIDNLQWLIPLALDINVERVKAFEYLK